MKKGLLFISFLILSVNCFSQKKTVFPFRGGKENMLRFFNDSLVVSPDIIQQNAIGTVIFKFTSDDAGNLSKIVICYADDAVLVPPIIEALKKSKHKWLLPDQQQTGDFMITFSYSFNVPPKSDAALQKSVYSFISRRKPIPFNNELSIDGATFLPTILVKYNIAQ